MAKRAAKAMEEPEVSQEELDAMIVEHLAASKAKAEELFGPNPSIDVALEIYARVEIGEDFVTAALPLVKAFDTLKETFKVAPTPDNTFKFFDMTDIEGDEEEDDE